MGLHHLFVAAEDTRDDAIGPVKFRIHGKAARGNPEGVHPSGPASLILRTMRVGLLDTIRGKARPHPFLDEDGGWRTEVEAGYSS